MLILGGSAETLGSGGAFLVAGGRDGEVATGVLVGIPACPTVATFGPADLWRGIQVGISYIPKQCCNGAGDTGNIL